MQYAPQSKATLHAFRYPKGRVTLAGKRVNYLNPRFKRKFVEMVVRLRQERGQVYQVTVLMRKKMPTAFQVMELPASCKGHALPTFGLPESGYCSAECETLFARKHPRAYAALQRAQKRVRRKGSRR